MASRAAYTKSARSSTTLAALTVIVMTGVNGTSTIVVLVCWPPFKAERERKGQRDSDTSVLDRCVGKPGLDLVHIEGWVEGNGNR